MVNQEVNFKNDIREYDMWKWRMSECGTYVKYSVREGVDDMYKRKVTSLDMCKKCDQLKVKWEKGVMCDEVGKEKVKITYVNAESNDEESRDDD